MSSSTPPQVLSQLLNPITYNQQYRLVFVLNELQAELGKQVSQVATDLLNAHLNEPRQGRQNRILNFTRYKKNLEGVYSVHRSPSFSNKTETLAQYIERTGREEELERLGSGFGEDESGGDEQLQEQQHPHPQQRLRLGDPTYHTFLEIIKNEYHRRRMYRSTMPHCFILPVSVSHLSQLRSWLQMSREFYGFIAKYQLAHEIPAARIRIQLLLVGEGVDQLTPHEASLRIRASNKFILETVLLSSTNNSSSGFETVIPTLLPRPLPDPLRAHTDPKHPLIPAPTPTHPPQVSPPSQLRTAPVEYIHTKTSPSRLPTKNLLRSFKSHGFIISNNTTNETNHTNATIAPSARQTSPPLPPLPPSASAVALASQPESEPRSPPPSSPPLPPLPTTAASKPNPLTDRKPQSSRQARGPPLPPPTSPLPPPPPPTPSIASCTPLRPLKTALPSRPPLSFINRLGGGGGDPSPSPPPPTLSTPVPKTLNNAGSAESDSKMSIRRMVSAEMISALASRRREGRGGNALGTGAGDSPNRRSIVGIGAGVVAGAGGAPPRSMAAPVPAAVVPVPAPVFRSPSAHDRTLVPVVTINGSGNRTRTISTSSAISTRSGISTSGRNHPAAKAGAGAGAGARTRKLSAVDKNDPLPPTPVPTQTSGTSTSTNSNASASTKNNTNANRTGTGTGNRPANNNSNKKNLPNPPFTLPPKPKSHPPTPTPTPAPKPRPIPLSSTPSPHASASKSEFVLVDRTSLIVKEITSNSTAHTNTGAGGQSEALYYGFELIDEEEPFLADDDDDDDDDDDSNSTLVSQSIPPPLAPKVVKVDSGAGAAVLPSGTTESKHIRQPARGGPSPTPSLSSTSNGNSISASASASAAGLSARTRTTSVNSFATTGGPTPRILRSSPGTPTSTPSPPPSSIPTPRKPIVLPTTTTTTTTTTTATTTTSKISGSTTTTTTRSTTSTGIGIGTGRGSPMANKPTVKREAFSPAAIVSQSTSQSTPSLRQQSSRYGFSTRGANANASASASTTTPAVSFSSVGRSVGNNNSSVASTSANSISTSGVGYTPSSEHRWRSKLRGLVSQKTG